MLARKKDCRRKFESAFLKMEKLAGVCALIFFEIGLVLQSNFASIFLEGVFFLKRNEVGLRECALVVEQMKHGFYARLN